VVPWTPPLKLILDRRFTDWDRIAADRAVVVDDRFDLLAAHQVAATLSVVAATSSVANSVVTLEQ
jgi:hypothetical protein